VLIHLSLKVILFASAHVIGFVGETVFGVGAGVGAGVGEGTVDGVGEGVGGLGVVVGVGTGVGVQLRSSII